MRPQAELGSRWRAMRAGGTPFEQKHLIIEPFVSWPLGQVQLTSPADLHMDIILNGSKACTYNLLSV